MSRFLKIVDPAGRPIRASSVFTGAHEGASTGRRLGYWGLSGAGANAALFSSLGSLRSRSREMVRNNPLAEGAEDAWVSNLIGTGISPRVQLEDPGLKREIQELWEDWVPEADADGRQDFYGLQTVGARALFHDGEFLARLLPR
ncbi:MAG: phage portal protein, partial [Pseudomonadota bacterium]